MSVDDLFDNELPDEQFLPDEHELRKEIKKLKKEYKDLESFNKRQEKLQKAIYDARQENMQMSYEAQISSLRAQIQELLTKNIELGDACKVFAKGIENLKRNEVIVTDTTTWERKGERTLAVRIKELNLDKKRIVSIAPLQTDHRGELTRALIVTEHTERFKTPNT